MSEQIAQMEAAKEVIRMKKKYESGNALGPGYNVSDKGQGLKKSANDIRSSSGLDDSRYGANVSLTDALTNYAQDFGDLARSSRHEAPNVYGGSDGGGGFDSEGRRQEYQDFMRGSVDSMYANQEAQLGAALQQQIAGLEKAYADAIAEGKVSVRDAERQFEEQKAEIQKAAFQQSQQTMAYGSNMGIGQSQQMVGLQQGDNARTNTIHNTNMSERDGRVNDIKDRINAIKSKKDLDISNAQAQHDYGLAGARAQADQAYMQGMGQFMGQDYFSDKEHGQNLEISDRNHRYNLDLEDVRNNNQIVQMAIQQGYNVENLDREQLYKLDYLSESNKLAVENMYIQGEINLEHLSKQIEGQLLTIDRSAYHSAKEGAASRAHSSSENAKSRAAQAKSEANRISNKIAEMDAVYQYNLQNDLKGVTPGTDEHTRITKQAEMQRNFNMQSMISEDLDTYSWTSVRDNPARLYDGEAPTMYQSPKSLSGRDIFPSGFINSITGKNSSQTKHNKATENKAKADEEYNNFLDSVFGR